ncbi:MAG: ABC transporter substrate-binding protein, partial [Turicibacter sp.]
MKMLKKLSTMFVLAMAFTLVACSGGNDAPATEEPTKTPSTNEGTTESTDGLTPMTTENITLTYASWDNAYMNEYLAQKFMEKYPNITVELVELDQGTWNEGLFNLASTGNLPDVFWYLGDVSASLDNKWLGDMTAYYNADLENANVPASLKEAGVFGDKRLSAPCKVLPFAIFLDKTVFEKLNVAMPSVDWTYSEMIELAKQMTVPEQSIFGMNQFTQLRTIAPIVNQDSIGEFGWNGESFDLTEFAKAIEQEREFSRTKVFPPAFGSEEAAQA